MEEYPFIVDELSLRAFVRFEISYAEMTENNNNVVFDEHRLCLEDLEVAIKNMKAAQVTRKTFCEEWYEHVFIGLREELGVTYNDRLSTGVLSVFNKEKDMVDCLFMWCKDQYEKYLDKIGDDEKINFNECIRSLRYYYENQDLEVPKRKFTAMMKRSSLRGLGTTSNINSAPLERRVLFKKFVNDLSKTGDVFGLRAKGFSLLFGNVCFKKDVEAAKKLFLDLYNDGEDPRTADLLGDLYYGYFDNRPDFAKAFQYYTISAFDGNAESLMKVAEMLSEGKGIVKNEPVAKAIVLSLFEQTNTEFCRGIFSSYFAEAALMLGKFCNRGISDKRDASEAFKYINIARYAMERRFKEYRTASDEAEMEEIRVMHDALSKEVGSNPNASSIISEVPNLLLTAMSDGYSVHVEVKPSKNEFRLITHRLRKRGEEHPSGIFMDFPLIEYCELTNVVEEYFPKRSQIWTRSNKKDFVADEMIFDSNTKVCEFKFKGEPVARIKTNMYVAKFR